jgi:hypothetical protein
MAAGQPHNHQRQSKRSETHREGARWTLKLVNIVERLTAEPCCEDTPAERRLFFKYMPSEIARTVLSNRTLRWTRPGTFNDPFDVQFDLPIRADLDATRERYINAFWDKHFSLFPKSGERWENTAQALAKSFDEAVISAHAILPDTNRDLRKHMDREKIICFASTPFSLPMWAYYAEQHHGAVLCFQSIPDGDSPYWIAQPVEYRDELPGLYDGDEFYRAIIREHRLDQAEIVRRMVYTKARAWEHEREWRIRSGDGFHPDAIHEDLQFDPRELVAIFLGCRIRDADVSALLDLAKQYPDVEVYQMTKAPDRFDLIPVLTSPSGDASDSSP